MRRLASLLLGLVLAGCGTYSTSSVRPAPDSAGAPLASDGTPQAAAAAAVRRPITAYAIPVTANDITDRPYQSLGDITVTVRKVTLFDADPTPAKVNEALQIEAEKLGADAIVLVRYGTVGIGAFSWGQLDGSGRAIRFTP